MLVVMALESHQTHSAKSNTAGRHFKPVSKIGKEEIIHVGIPVERKPPESRDPVRPILGGFQRNMKFKPDVS